MPDSLYINSNNTLTKSSASNVTLFLGSINGSFSPGDVVYQQDSSNTTATVVSYSSPTLVVSGANSFFSSSDNFSAPLFNLNSASSNAQIIGVDAPLGIGYLSSLNLSNGSSSNVILNTNTVIVQTNTTVNTTLYSNSLIINGNSSVNSGLYSNALILNGNSSVNSSLYANGTLSLQNSSSNASLQTTSLSLVINSTANVTVNSAGITYSNSSVTFTFKPPTAAQVTAGNYFLAANGTWTLLTVP